MRRRGLNINVLIDLHGFFFNVLYPHVCKIYKKTNMGKVKAKRCSLSESANRKDRVQKKKLNPFEMHVNRKKHNVIGQKLKSERGVPGVSRSRAMQKRKASLLQEYKIRDKSNKFFDRRIGEKNSVMTHEDKVIARFTKERMKMFKKKQIYNLADDEVLTHRGQTLSEIEKFDNPGSDDDDDVDDPGKLNAKFVGDAHFGGGMFKEGEKNSRQSLIEQLIAESKKRKAEKQRTREQTVELTEKLDTEWHDLLPIVASSKKKPSDFIEIEKPDSYDTMLRELKFEARGYASDPLKTVDEIEEEERKKRAEFEAERTKRMKPDIAGSSLVAEHRSADDLNDGFALDDQSDTPFVTYDSEGNIQLIGPTGEETDEEQETIAESEKSKDSHKDEEPDDDDDDNDDDDDDDDDGDDDGGSDVSLSDLKPDSENEGYLEPHVEQEQSSDENENEESEDEEGEDDGKKGHEQEEGEEEEEEEEEKDDDDEQAENGSESGESENEKQINKERKNIVHVGTEPREKKENVKTYKKTVPNTVNTRNETYVTNVLTENEKKIFLQNVKKKFPDFCTIPEKYKKLKVILKSYDAEKQAVVISHLIEKNHVSLHEDNRSQLEMLFGLLLQHLKYISSQDVVKCFKVLNSLAPALYDLVHLSPENTSNSILEMLKEKQQEFQKHQHKYPPLDTLILLKIISFLFPTSDFQHPVVTPSIVFMCQMLFQCRVKTKRDITVGLFLVTLFLEFTVLSKRFSPAAVNFLSGIFHLAIPKLSEDSENVCAVPPFRRIGLYSDLLVLESKVEQMDEPSQMRLSDLSDEGSLDTGFKMRAFATALAMYSELLQNVGNLSASAALFHRSAILLSKVPTQNYPARLQSEIEKLSGAYKQLKERKVQYLVIARKRPKALRLYEPRIEQILDTKRRKPMPKEEMEKEKLLHKIKREKKAAVREIRRDNNFLSKLKWKETLQSDAERLQKVKEIFGSAANQMGELRALERKKKYLKK